ncbi:MAG: LptE family protein [Acidobacteriaceae bacterium]|nr:LptE family protein [Acidobacteriaceae bacterium]MBV9778580.1 LptE family protein [Acidobacteriaceae bacterium]
MRRYSLFACGAAILFLGSCGYHVGGKADLVPKSVQTVAIPAFGNLTLRYKLGDTLPREIAREFRARGRFRIEDDPSAADAVLNGTILSVGSFATVADPTTGKATSVRVMVSLSVNFLERRTGRVLYSQPNLTLAQNYDIAVDPHQFFDESDPAFDRLNRDLAHTIVSGILENF